MDNTPWYKRSKYLFPVAYIILVLFLLVLLRDSQNGNGSDYFSGFGEAIVFVTVASFPFGFLINLFPALDFTQRTGNSLFSIGMLVLILANTIYWFLFGVARDRQRIINTKVSKFFVLAMLLIPVSLWWILFR
mgnify:CR=1 FL=1